MVYSVYLDIALIQSNLEQIQIHNIKEQARVISQRFLQVGLQTKGIEPSTFQLGVVHPSRDTVLPRFNGRPF